MDDLSPLCIQCGYNLTALTSPRCPECGWVIDWQLAKADEERLRLGTPVYRAAGRRRWAAIFPTLGLMLFRPIRFARMLRWDEPLWPGIVVAVVAYLISFLPASVRSAMDTPKELGMNPVYLSAIVTCMATSIIAFTLFSRSGPQRPNARQRLRLMLLASLYSTCFVAAWDLGSSGPPLVNSWNDAEFFWLPAGDFAGQWQKLAADRRFLGTTLIYYWWFGILATFVAVRARPRWVAVTFAVVPPLAAFLAARVADLVFSATGL